MHRKSMRNYNMVGVSTLLLLFYYLSINITFTDTLYYLRLLGAIWLNTRSKMKVSWWYLCADPVRERAFCHRNEHSLCLLLCLMDFLRKHEWLTRLTTDSGGLAVPTTSDWSVLLAGHSNWDRSGRRRQSPVEIVCFACHELSYQKTV